MKNLSAIKELELYETLPIQTILDYKWNAFAYNKAFN